jgi:hypothetical protein
MYFPKDILMLDFDMWPVAYIHLTKRGYKGGYASEEMFQAFGAKPRGGHDALEDARIAADILRQLCEAKESVL